MKVLTLILSLSVIAGTTQHVFAAEQINNSTNKQVLGVVSASNALTLDELVNSLSQKADEQGATSFKVLSAGGDNKLHGSAEIYK